MDLSPLSFSPLRQCRETSPQFSYQNKVFINYVFGRNWAVRNPAGTRLDSLTSEINKLLPCRKSLLINTKCHVWYFYIGVFYVLKYSALFRSEKEYKRSKKCFSSRTRMESVGWWQQQYKPTCGKQQRSRMGTTQQLEVGPLRKTMDNLQYQISQGQSP